MADTPTAALYQAVKELLAGADLSTINKKKVRLHLNEKFGYDFAERKEEINKILMDALTEAAEKQQDENESDASGGSEDENTRKRPRKSASAKKRTPKDSESEEEEEDDDDSDSDDGHRKKKRAANGSAKGRKPVGGGGGGAGGAKGGKTTGYLKKLKLSPDLAEVMGEDHMARNEVVKKMYAIVKERDLLDPKNRQFAILDPQLQKVFGQKRIRMFGMMKLLGKHFSAAD